MEKLNNYRKNIYSENGEDGIIEKIFSEIPPSLKLCCEFGAWDGIWASNCRNLIANNGWDAVMIEGDPIRYQDLLKTYNGMKNIRCLNKYVDANKNSLNNILTEYERKNLDLLSIDIDGLDYEIFENIDFYPKVICIEVNTGHSPKSNGKIPRDIAKNNVGQPLAYFLDIARSKGYELVCFTGNAFFIRKDLLNKTIILPLSILDAYKQHISRIPNHVRKHLFFVNKGMTNPYYKFNNSYLTKKGLELGVIEILIKVLTIYTNKLKTIFNRLINYLKHITRIIIRV